MTRRKALLAAAAIGLAAQFSTSVPAQAAGEPPCSTAKLIVPWGAGGDTYVIFQIFEEAVNRLSPKHKIQLVTVPGQGGNKGAKEAAKAKADGCTLFAIHQSALISYLNGRIDFTWDKFEPVAHLTSTPEVFAASGKAPWKTFKEMLAEAKAKPTTTLAKNVLEIATPPGNPKKVTGLASLADASTNVVLCAETVPCGSAADAVLTKAAVTAHVVPREVDVKATLAKITLGEADAAIVYHSDVVAAGSKVEGVEIPAAQNTTLAYPLVRLTDTAATKAFADLLASAAGLKELETVGFLAP